MTGHDGWADADTAQQLTADLADLVSSRYRVSQADALAVARELLAAQNAIGAAVAAGLSAAQIERTRQFKDLVSVARRRVYYQLRRYDRQDAGARASLRRLEELRPGERPDSGVLLNLASGHVSTAERIPGLAEFHAALFDAIGSPGSVLDVGCGIYPVQFPFDEQGAPVASYVAADKDPASLAVLRALARARGDGRLVVVPFDLRHGWQALTRQAGRDRFDVAFMFKLVPVVRRQDKMAYQNLGEVPADLIVLTGATTSMTRHQSIERRECNVLLRFASDAGLAVLSHFAVGQEYLVVARR